MATEEDLKKWLDGRKEKVINKIINSNPNADVSLFLESFLSSTLEIKSSIQDIRRDLDTITHSIDNIEYVADKIRGYLSNLVVIFGLVGSAVAVSMLKIAFF